MLNRKTTTVILAALMLAGAVLRLGNLDALSLHGDEGYQAMAVAGILEHGAPVLDSRYVYDRAPLFSYTQAACAAVCGRIDGLSLRLPAALAGLFCIPAVFWLGATLLDRRGGLLLATLIAFSTWHIEMSRYGRFYTMFQLLFVLALVMFYLGFYRGHIAAMVGYAVATLIAISLHDLGIMMGVLFLTVIPLRSITLRRKAAYVGGLLAVGAARTIYYKLLWQVFAAYEVPWQEWVDPAGTSNHTAALGQINLPTMVHLLSNLHKVHVVGILLPIPLLAITVIVWTGVKDRRYLPTLTAVGMVLAAMIHELALMVLLGLVYLAFFVRNERDLRRRQFVLALLGGTVTLGLWGAFLLYTRIATSFSDVLLNLTRFPDIGRYYLSWLLAGWPVLLVIGLAGWIMLLPSAAREDEPGAPKPHWFALTALIGPVYAMAMLNWKFSEARYFFHLYPLMLVGCVAAALALADALQRKWPAPRGVMVTACAVVLLFVGQDTNPIAAASYARHGQDAHKNPYRAALNWSVQADYHPDPRKVSRYVAAHRRPGDLVIGVGPPHVAALYCWYVGQLDAQIGRLDNYVQLAEVAGDDQPHYPITGARVIYQADQLRQLLDEADGHTVWLLADHRVLAEDAGFLLDEDLRQMLLTRFAEPVCTGLDGISYVARAGKASDE
ncbi:MAG: glycosyltransferase family 39 protein [Phycisphaeraceae bacterium]|nr:glycosyltransferase family 39 protein [Phycisphaeraceae bacterium]